MSDTRKEANQELVEAGLASGMEEDSLGASLSSSFSPAPRTPTHKESASVTAAVAEATPDESNEQQREIPGMAEWKDTLEGYNQHWLAESSEARAKAEATRTRIENERAAASKSSSDASKAKKAEEKARADEIKRAEKLRQELSGSPGLKRSQGKHLNLGETGDREKRVKEAWEMVKGSSSAPAISSSGGEGVVHAGDARGVMPQDIRAGQALAPGQSRPAVHQTAYDPTSSRDPLPPSMQSSASSPAFGSTSQTLSRHSATSGWDEVSPPSSSSAESPSSGDLLNAPRSTNRLGQSLTDPVPRGISPGGLSGPDLSLTSGATPRPGQHNTPPSQPPSLTLSLFTMPSHLSFSRVVAVLGINLLLPFINGVMLGFGEIFAREVFRVGRLVFRGERTWFGERRSGSDRFAGGRGAAGVGLSGSGGF